MSVGKYLTQAQRDELVNVRCTLDGRPAVVRGRLLPFALVAVLPNVSAPRAEASVEFAWSTVARIIARDGAFKS